MEQTLGPFMGLVTSLDPEQIPDTSASDLLNVRIEDGVIKQAYGYRNLAAAQASLTNVYGFHYLQGYNNSYAEVEEYLSIEKISGTVKPYSRNVTTGAPTVITNGANALSLTASEIGVSILNGIAYITTPGDTYPLVKHTIGTNTSWTSVKTPADPTTALTYKAQYGGGGNPHTQNAWTGVNVATNITYGGCADNGSGANASTSVTSDGLLVIHHTSYQGIASIKVDLRPTNASADLDWTNYDQISLQITSYLANGMTIDPSSLKVTVFNAAGTSYVADDVKLSGKTNSTAPGTNLTASATFKNKVRTDWATIRYIQFDYLVTYGAIPGLGQAGTADPELVFSKLTLGGVDLAPSKVGDSLTFGYTYDSTSLGFESGIAGTVAVPYDFLKGLNGLGSWVRLTWVASADSNVDHVKLYVQTTDYATGTKTWRLVASTATGTLYADYKLTYVEALALAAQTSVGGSFPYANLTCSVAYKGKMVWGYSGGYQNIKFADPSNPLKVYNNTDPTLLTPDNPDRPVTFTLADNMGDDPLAMFSAANSLFIVGSYGVYHMEGDRNGYMTPPARIRGSLGCAGRYACCAWKDEKGVPGVVYLTKNAEAIHFIPGYNYMYPAQVAELSHLVRQEIRTFFGSSTDFSTARLAVDESRDALYLIVADKAMVLRRPSAVDGTRQWELYQFAHSVGYLGFSVRRRMRWIRTTGEVDEYEWNSNTSAFITGTLSYGGSAPTSIYWKSKVFTGENRRVNMVRVDRETMTDTPTIQAISERETTSTAVASGKNNLRFGFKQQGHTHQFKISLADGSGGVRRLVIEMFGPLGKRRLS